MGKTIHITHYDLDGFGPIIINHYFGIKPDDYLIIDYKDIWDEENFILDKNFPSLQHYDKAIITDISTHGEFFEWVKRSFKEYSIFDHHILSETIKDQDNCVIDTNRSGSKIYFDFLSKGKRVSKLMFDLIDLIDTYDLYNQNSPLWEDALNLNRVFMGYANWTEKDNYLKNMKFLNSQIRKLDSRENEFKFTDSEYFQIQKAIEKEEKEYKLALENMKIKTDEKGNLYIVYKGSAKVSIVCNRIMKEYPKIKYILNINTFYKINEKKVNGKVSARSLEDRNFNVTDLNGINGHSSAGGGKYDSNFLEKLFLENNFHLGYKDV